MVGHTVRSPNLPVCLKITWLAANVVRGVFCDCQMMEMYFYTAPRDLVLTVTSTNLRSKILRVVFCSI